MPQKLKVDFHTHSAEDPNEHIKFDAFQLIDAASVEGFDAIAITNHNVVTYNKSMAQYAERKGILLIPGMEAAFSSKHVLIINPDFMELHKGAQLDELASIKNDRNLIIAPHPFFPGNRSLKSCLYPYVGLFDAIEYSHYYNHFINMNKKAVLAARNNGLPLIGTSDCHNIWQLGRSYTLVDAKKDTASIIEAVKKGAIELRTSPMSVWTMTRVVLNFILSERLKVSLRI